MSNHTPQELCVGWIGTGVMGAAMVRRLLAAGFQVLVNTRTRARAEETLAAGAEWCDSAVDLLERCDIVATMVGFPTDVEAVYFGEEGLLSAQARGQLPQLLIDFTTSHPELAQRIAAAARTRGTKALDAPVSGGDVGAQQGKLSIMVGGEPSAFQLAEPLFKVLGQSARHQGGPGAGQHTKMVNQILIASGMVGVAEALTYAEKVGLETQLVLESVSRGAAGSWSLDNLAPRILRGDFSPGFFVEHFIKDLGIALDVAEAERLALPGLALAKQLYESVRALGHGRSGTQAIYWALKNLSGLSPNR